VGPIRFHQDASAHNLRELDKVTGGRVSHHHHLTVQLSQSVDHGETCVT
jgi:hypothetical protein